MKGFGLALLVALVVVAAVMAPAATIIVDETEQAVVVELGRPVRSLDRPGLYFKTPFVQSATFFEKRLLEYDSAPTDILTRDKKTLKVDNYARWRVVNPLLFLQKVHDERGAQSRLDDIIYSELRVELGRWDLTDVVAGKRAQIMATVTERADQIARQFGIQIVDVRIKRTDLPQENEKSVFERMRAERQQQATQFRSEGQEEAAKIRAATDKERAIILAEAYRQAETVRGDGDARAIRIYAEAFNRDPEFYEFLRSLEAYRKSFGSKSVLVLPPDAPLLRHLGLRPDGRAVPPAGR